jgi:nuclear transcription Y subunit beta
MFDSVLHPKTTTMPRSFHPFFHTWVGYRASDRCQREKRKTINGDDLLWAITALEFAEYVEPLRIYLAKFKESEKVAAGGSATGKAGGATAGQGSHLAEPRE